MRVALTHPFCWPHVRRGTERYLDALLRFLRGRGFDVTLISGAPARAEVSLAGDTARFDVTLISGAPAPGPGAAPAPAPPGVKLCPIPRAPGWLDRRLPAAYRFFWPCLRELAGASPEVVHSFFLSDALAADLLKRSRRFRTVLQIHGPVVPGFLRRLVPPERAMAARVIARADRIVVPSRYVADTVREHYRVEARVLRCPIELEGFAPDLRPRTGAPVILSVADFTVRGKGARVLVDAFARVLRTHPEARLRLSGNAPPPLRAELAARVAPAVRDRIEFLGLGASEDLPRLYREATVMALPTVRDAAPYVLFESWACGTPVVAADHGGVPEYVDPAVGVLFDPATDGPETRNASGLARAICEGIALAARAHTPARCRAHAERHRFERFADEIEDIYRF